MAAEPPCKICGTTAAFIGEKPGKFKTDARFQLYRCPACAFAFIQNPWTDYAEIYSEAYYRGLGADPAVDYLFELQSPERSVRRYEWRGILQAVRSCFPVERTTRWLDFGCGNGGLVRYCQERATCDIAGYEQGWIRDQAVAAGIKFLEADDLDRLAGSFDVVTAIEVLEHVADPLLELRRIRSLLRPGGLFFFTTGNAAPFRDNLLAWPYVLPEVHISFYEPGTLALALEKAGFAAEFRGFTPGFRDVICFKVLKTLGIRRASPVQRMLPWSVLSRLVDQKRKVSGMPVGWAK